jgi:tetratricopeptide (TPR) repeat protein
VARPAHFDGAIIVERRFSALTRTSLMLCALAGSAHARPASGDAKLLFDQALAAFANADYPAAIDGFSKSFDLQADADTLLAWAKAEHKVGDCGKAIELFDKLLAFKLPALDTAHPHHTRGDHASATRTRDRAATASDARRPNGVAGR